MEVYRKDELNNRMVHTGLDDVEFIEKQFDQAYGLSDDGCENLKKGVYLESARYERFNDFQKASLTIEEDYFDEEDFVILKNIKIDLSDIYLSDITRPIDSDDGDVDLDEEDEDEEFFVELQTY